MKRLFVLCTLSILIMLSVSAAQAGDVTLPAPIKPATTVIPINVGAGSQSDAHIGGTLVSFTNDAAITYYDLASGQSGVIPHVDGSYDLLSDVSEGKIAFARATDTGYQPIYVFDVNSPGTGPSPVPAQPNPIPGRRPRIGHGTIAWEAAQVTKSTLEMAVYDPVGGNSIVLTNDDQQDEYPAVSADGATVVWAKCSGAACNVYQATRGNGWTPVQLTGKAGQPAGVGSTPDTNGQVVVYFCERNAEADICWQPVGGGNETRLLMPGLQRQPHISGNVISFESSAANNGQFDLYVYDLATEILYQVTDTPAGRALGDISIGPDGKVYVTWTQPKQVYPFDRDVYALSFVRQPRASLSVRPLFDQGRSYKLGSVVPLKLQLLNAQGTNVSSASLLPTVTGLVQKDSTAAALTPDAPGNSNPDNAFRYDATLQGYIYNLSTTGLSIGTWELQFRVPNDPATYRINFDLR